MSPNSTRRVVALLVGVIACALLAVTAGAASAIGAKASPAVSLIPKFGTINSFG